MRNLIITAVAVLACAFGAVACGSSAPQKPPATAEALATQLKTAGLPMAQYVAYTAETDPNHLLGRQDGYSSKINWSGGSIEVFQTADEAQQRVNYLKSFGPPLGDGYDYISGTAVLRIFSTVTPSEAKQYEAAFTK